MPKNNAPFMIKVQLGNKRSGVVIDPSHEFSSFSLHQVLHFTSEQRLFVKILALEDDENKLRISFHHDPNIRMGTYLKKEQLINDLKPNKTYNLIIQDTRDATVENLTKEEHDDIKRIFDEMDKDKSGCISLMEVKNFYKNEMEINLRVSRKIADKKIQQHVIFRERYEKDYENDCKFFKSIMDSNITHFMQQDTDNNSRVTWDEFVKHHARIKISQRR